MDPEQALSQSVNESTGGFEMFRSRATHPRGLHDAHWRTGFDPAFRAGSADDIAVAIFFWFDSLLSGARDNGFLLDVGSGASELTDALTSECHSRGISHVVVDSSEMLSHLKPHRHRIKIPGEFPSVLSQLKKISSQFSRVLAYSVLQYVIRDREVLPFVDSLAELLPSGGALLIGDIPNRDKRDRQLTALDLQLPPVASIREIRDEEVMSILMRLRTEGFNAFVVPQFATEPMNLHRENIVVQRPTATASY